MPLVATPGGATSNSYATASEYDAYNESRFPSFTAFANDDAKDAALIHATRMLDMMLSGGRLLVRTGPNSPYIRVLASWSGLPSTATQALAWPRTGMYDRNGNAIAVNVVPRDLKNAVCELAGWLGKGERLADSDPAVQGISSLSAGPVSISFRDGIDTTKPIPDSVMYLLVPSWINPEYMEQSGGQTYLLDVID